MNKSIKKRQNYNAEILILLQEKFGFSIDYIRKSLRGDRTGIMPEVLKKEYNILSAAINAAIKSFKNKVL